MFLFLFLVIVIGDLLKLEERSIAAFVRITNRFIMNAFQTSVLLLLLPAICLAIDLKPYNETAHGMFITADTNLDGVITLDEIAAVYRGYDVNGDGRVSRHEYTSFVDLHTPTLHDLSHALYDIYDVDGDHHLDQHDFENFFALIDKNQDGLVQEIEFVEYWTVLFIDLEHLHGHGANP